MPPVKPPQDMSSRASASAEDLDQHMLGNSAASAEADRIAQWDKPNFAQGGRHQSQLDPAFGVKERKQR